MATANTKRNPDADINDFYTTPPSCVKALLEREKFTGDILEPCAGTGRISNYLKGEGYNVKEIDKFYRGNENIDIIDFFDYNSKHDNIITNPPYKSALQFIEHSLDITNKKVAMLLRVNFLETPKRSSFLMNSCLKTVYFYSSRVKMWKDDIYDTKGSAVFYAWFVFDKEYKLEPIIKWI